MTRFARPAAAALAVILLASPAAADDARIDHYAPKDSETLEEAVANFSAYNEKLAGVLARDRLDVADLEAVHEITYTLETALARMRADLDDLAETLEALHLASEDHAEDETREHGARYLTTARTLAP